MNPHCCACNNPITSNINSTSAYTNHGQGGVYHGHAQGQQNHNNQSHIQQNHDIYSNCNDHMVTSNDHAQRTYNTPQSYGHQDFQRMGKPSLHDATQFYICECTSCRNLGNSVDICCQCCNCGNVTATVVQDENGEQEIVQDYASPRGYHVSSVTLTGDTDDTLEVVFDDSEGVTEGIDDHHQHPNIHKINKGCNNTEGHQHVHRDDGGEVTDDIAFAHTVAESCHNHQGRQIQTHPACVNCNPCPCSGKPVFQGWATHHVPSNIQQANPHQQHPQQQHSRIYANKTNANYHHHHHTSQGAVHTNRQHCVMSSHQQDNMQMNSHGHQNHHGHPPHPHYNHHNQQHISRNTNQQKSSNMQHHSKQHNHRVTKSHTCCSQGKIPLSEAIFERISPRSFRIFNSSGLNICSRHLMFFVYKAHGR